MKTLWVHSYIKPGTIKTESRKIMIRKISIILSLLMIAAAAMALTGCGGETAATAYADGTYEAKSSVFTNDDGTEDGNGYGVVTITIKDGVISECIYQTYEVDGSLKDENYGKQNGEVANKDYFSKAQKAVAACDQYAKMLVEKGSLKDIDAISGATVNYNEFVEAVGIALADAAEAAKTAE